MFLGVVLIWISIIMSEHEYLLSFQLCIFFVCKLSVHVFCPFFYQDFNLLLPLVTKSSLYIRTLHSSSVMYTALCPTLSFVYWFYLWCFVSWQCDFFLIEPKWSIFSFIASGQLQVFPILSLYQNSSCFLLILVWFHMLPFLSLIHLEFILVIGVR